MYTVEFQTGNIDSTNISNISGMKPWNNDIFREPPTSDNMRINIRATYINKNGQRSIHNDILLPTQNQLDNNVDYQFTIPQKENDVNISLFGVKLANLISANNITGWSVWNGAVRNIMLFRKFLSQSEITNLFKEGIKKYYPWLEENEYVSLTQLDNNSYFGSVYCKNMHAISVLGSILKQNTQSLNLTFINQPTN